MIQYCDECGYEIEIGGTSASPVANGYEPIYEDDGGFFFDIPHLNNVRGECESRIVVYRTELVNL